MESILKFLVVLVVIAGLLWVVSPLVSGAISGGISKAPDLKISDQTYEIIPIPETECFKNMCEIHVSGTLYNFGGSAKNILITVSFFDKLNKNIGGVNMPRIKTLDAQQTTKISFSANFTCETKSASATVLYSDSG